MSCVKVRDQGRLDSTARPFPADNSLSSHPSPDRQRAKGGILNQIAKTWEEKVFRQGEALVPGVKFASDLGFDRSLLDSLGACDVVEFPNSMGNICTRMGFNDDSRSRRCPNLFNVARAAQRFRCPTN